MTEKTFMGFKNQAELDAYIPHSRSSGELYLEALEELAVPYPSIELPSFPKFNELVGGFRMREFSIICGSTGCGKTTLLANWAKDFMELGHRCFIMSVETGPLDFLKRTMGVYMGKDLNKGRAASVEVLQTMHQNYGHAFSADRLFLSLYDNRIDYQTVIRDIEWHHDKKDCKIVFIDNLNFLLEVVSANRQVEVMDTVVHELIMLAKRTDVHIVLIMHPKKTEHGRVESEFDIKGSSTAVQEAHNVFLLNRPKQKDIENATKGPFLRELTIRKLRRMGENIGKSIWMTYSGAGYKESSI